MANVCARWITQGNRFTVSGFVKFPPLCEIPPRNSFFPRPQWFFLPEFSQPKNGRRVGSCELWVASVAVMQTHYYHYVRRLFAVVFFVNYYHFWRPFHCHSDSCFQLYAFSSIPLCLSSPMAAGRGRWHRENLYAHCYHENSIFWNCKLPALQPTRWRCFVWHKFCSKMQFGS